MSAENPQIMICAPYTAPCGVLLLGTIDNRLCLCDWQASRNYDGFLVDVEERFHAECRNGESETLTRATQQLDEYFAGQRKTFDLHLDVDGSFFQNLVWSELLQIPFGETRSYLEVAERVGNPLATRAVANACRANPLSLFIPCHRVIRSDGSLGGYAGGLREVKEWLLEWERSLAKEK